MSEKSIYHTVRLSIFLIIVALIAGTGGCFGQPPPESSYKAISDWYDLNDIRDNLGGSYRLMNNLNENSTGYKELVSAAVHEGQGWRPIGTEFSSFTGWFDGQGYNISGLFINCTDRNYVGLFGYVGRSGVIENINVLNVTVAGNEFVGGLVGRNDGTVTINSSSSGRVTGTHSVGGLVGWNSYGRVMINSYSTCSVNGTKDVGGLVGYNGGTVSNSYSTGSVKGTEYVGGLVGENYKGTVSISYSKASVTGASFVGGLVGHNNGGTVSISYSKASVTGENYVGGLVGYNDVATVTNTYSSGRVEGTSSSVGGLVGYNAQGGVSNSYSNASVNGNDYVGGLAGHNSGGIVSYSYSTGRVTGNKPVGGLVGSNDAGGTVSDSFWDKETSGMMASDGGTGKSTTEMKNLLTFYDTATGVKNPWSISTDTNSSATWYIINNQTYPFLSWQFVH
jgi:hypothetical protein